LTTDQAKGQRGLISKTEEEGKGKGKEKCRYAGIAYPCNKLHCCTFRLQPHIDVY